MTWKPYRFRWKPCEPDRRPRFTTPHMPRLDWQMWFAALAGDCRGAPGSSGSSNACSRGRPRCSPSSATCPFPEHPPRYVRARLSLYTFTRWGSHDWWDVEEAGLYCPPIGKTTEPGP